MRRAAAVLVLALTLALSPTVRSAAAGESPAARAERLLLVEQTAWVAPTGDFRLRLDVDRPPPGATISVDLHSRLSGRIQFHESVTGEELGPVFAAGPQLPMDGTAPPEQGVEAGWRMRVTPAQAVDVTLAIRTRSPFDPARTLVPEEGVYPLVVTLSDADGEQLDQLVTHLVRLPADDDQSPPLLASLVVPVHAPVALQPDGSTTLAPDDLDDLEATIVALADHPEVALAVQPTAETIDALARLEDPVLSDLLRSSLDDRQVLASTYVDLDLSSWVSGGLGEDLGPQTTTSADRLALELDVRPDGRTWIADSTITPEALTRLRELGVDQVVLPESILGPLDDDAFELTLTQTFDVLNSAGGLQRAIAADTVLNSYASGDEDPVLAAHQLLADLGVLYFDSPALSRGTAVVLPAGDAVDPRFLDALLTGLEAPSVVAAVTPNALFRDTKEARAEGELETEGDVLVRPFTPEPSPPLGDYPEELRSMQRQLAGYRSMTGADGPPDELDALELVSGAAELTEQGRVEYLDAIEQRIADAVAAVQVEQQAITLTDRRGIIPLSVRNDLDEPVTVRVVVESDKLEFPDGPELVEVVEPGIATLEMEVEARTSGAFPVEVSVTSPDQIITLSETRVTVRSTAVSGLGIVLSLFAGLFLLVWWARHFRSVRRAKGLVNTRHPAAQRQAEEAQRAYIDEISK